ncbi:MAG: hypothetical protein KF745_02340 [Phycisphaeraceae bacterium]|nr:hypothetical protein [Phycisphaeraceae bacterium]
MVTENDRAGRWAGDEGPSSIRETLASRTLTRPQIVDRILSMNPSATAGFLDRFTDRALSVYLDHLVSAQRPRGRDAVWERPGDTPAILSVPVAGRDE